MDKRSIHFVVPGTIQRKTGGYGYDRRIIDGLRKRGRDVRLHELEGRFPRPDATAVTAATNMIESALDGALVIVDGLALPAFASLVERNAPRLCIIALIHHLLADETSLDDADRCVLGEIEIRCLGAARSVIVTSPTTATSVLRAGVSRKNISVVTPGTKPVSTAIIPDCDETGPLRLLSVGSVIPRKGYRILISALAACRTRDWRLTIVGSLRADSATTAEVRELIDREDLVDRIHLTGELDDAQLQAEYRRADVFVLASEFEGYGMAFAEAMAQSLPIVGSGGGAVADTVQADCGLLVPVGDAAALTDALDRVMTDAPLRCGLAAGAARAGRQLPSWGAAAAKFDTVLEAAIRATPLTV
ncbi:MAG: glycosyltransferase family 4 protein [Rhodospirillaceae bacterium]|jgi:glycosyltransferase involved in cell wall biosynthesis|nr:glycosyltransferase family 4 protein [Rhodospirillaceae bacterium]MBT5664621.1 glycosyltransferase family 4 protein [Rhodospirillaceae bacterium]MBT5812488.1 glycosyltransferase family 4 protein [Rhodospirillaceae bacterium]